MKSLFFGLAFLLSYVGFEYADTKAEPEGDFVRGLKTGSASALIPGFGQTYVGLALLGARFDTRG